MAVPCLVLLVCGSTDRPWVKPRTEPIRMTRGVPVGLVQLDSATLHHPLPIPLSVCEAKDYCAVSVHDEDDGDSPLKAIDAQPRADVVSQMPALGALSEAAQMRFEPFQIAKRHRR